MLVARVTTLLRLLQLRLHLLVVAEKLVLLLPQLYPNRNEFDYVNILKSAWKSGQQVLRPLTAL